MSSLHQANLYQLLQERFAVAPAATCLALPDGSAYSYGDLDHWSARPPFVSR